ncbi:MAG: hypothetical protein ABI614_29260 [Planctomycetota bacterium]
MSGLVCVTYRRPIIAVALLGIAASWFLPHVILAIHEAHGMSTAHELHTLRLIDRHRLDEVRTELKNPDYSVEQRIRAVGGLHTYIPILSILLALPFIVITVMAWLSRPTDSETVSSGPTT